MTSASAHTRSFLRLVSQPTNQLTHPLFLLSLSPFLYDDDIQDERSIKRERLRFRNSSSSREVFHRKRKREWEKRRDEEFGIESFFFFFFVAVFLLLLNLCNKCRYYVDEYAIVFFVTIVGKTSLEKKMVIEFLPQHLSARWSSSRSSPVTLLPICIHLVA